MPNQRAKDKVFVGLFIERKLKTAVTREATKQGVSTSQFVATVLSEWTAQRGSRDEDRQSGVHSGLSEPAAVQPSVPDDEVWRL